MVEVCSPHVRMRDSHIPRYTSICMYTSLLKMERLKHACFMHVSAHFMRPNPESSMHEISSDNIE